MPNSKTGTLDYETYSSERKELYKYQQAAYDSYEKTLITLTSSFLAFSIGLLGYLQSSKPNEAPAIAPGTEEMIYTSWICLSLSLMGLLACFFLNARAFAVEMGVLDDALTNPAALTKRNWWTTASHVLYGSTTILFAVGLFFLLYFSHHNFLR